MDKSNKHELLLNLAKFLDEVCISNNIWYSLAFGSMIGAVRHKGFIPWDNDIDVYIRIDQIEQFREAVSETKNANYHLYQRCKDDSYILACDRLSYLNSDQNDIHIDIIPIFGLPNDLRQRKCYMTKCSFVDRIVSCKYKDTRYSKKIRIPFILVLKIILKFFPDRYLCKVIDNLQYKYDIKESDYIFALSNLYKSKNCFKKELFEKYTRVEFESINLNIISNYHTYLFQIYGDYMIPKKQRGSNI